MPAFDPVNPRQSFPELERGILKYWREEGVFQRSIEQRMGGETFSFYDGPPFATGLPHYGHLLAGTIKDVIPRYQTMRGKQVRRRFGWDCHGLPIENLIEKEHGIKSKRQIEEMGVAKFNALCRASVQRYTKEWRTAVERMGRWVDMDWDYKTMEPSYMESIWWAFSQVHSKGLLYEGHRPIHICPRCATPLSNFEVGQGYKEITDQTATVIFEMEEGKETGETREAKERIYMLAWTTTPWTLPGNLFLAVHPEVKYVHVECEGKTYVVAKDLVENVFGEKSHKTKGRAVSGKSLVGKTYTPLFPYFAKAYAKAAFRIVAGDFVTTEDGTGIVHIAPGFGEDDFIVGQREGIDPPLQHVTMEGRFVTAVKDFADEEVKPADDPMKTDRKLVEWLQSHHLLFAAETYRHSYPHCWRCDTPLLNFATSSWFVNVEAIKDQLLGNAEKITWMPPHLKEGRFGKWLQGARDWSISRNRYWGTPLPIWRNENTGAIDVINGRDDLMQHQRLRFTKVTALRHGESEGNLVPVYQAEMPGTDLTARGRTQATAAAERLRTEPIDVIYCSPLARTRQTAEILAEATGARVIVDERLREVRFGEYEGKVIDFSDLNLVRAKRARKIEDISPETIFHFPGMETWRDVQNRTADFLKDILPRHPSEHVVIVTHADVVTNMRHFFTKEDPVKLSHRPFVNYATPETFYWDHLEQRELDLHRETVDTISWPGPVSKDTVQLTMVRHGQTDYNLQKIIQGSEADLPLNATGQEQARACAKKLKGQKFDVLITSNLKRAIETAEVIGKELGLPVTEKHPLFRERDLGAWCGKPIDEILRAHPGTPDLANRVSFHHLTPKDGESLPAFFARAGGAAAYIRSAYPGKRVLLVTHGGFLRAMRSVTENLSYQEALSIPEEPNCSLTSLELHPALTRIPDILDCWFESGSMPYAQSHFPFEGIGDSPPGFPADFIAEGIDQTRLWFYTLHVLGTILFDEAPYRNVVVNGIVLAEDGRKMSKRLKNYPDPLEVVERHGADALRFALMSSPAVRGEDLRFSEKVVEETVRSVLLPLWNAYTFFVTYANAAHFDPPPVRTASPHPLDRMIRAATQDLVNRMTAQLDAYDLSATCAELHETVDLLTNWYIRLSRRRFAGKGAMNAAEADTDDQSASREQALTTLYDVLIALTKLLSPFMPFVSEAMYLNLVPAEHGSVHLADWPGVRTLTSEEKATLAKTETLRIIVSLGMQVRAEQKIKVRQPLARITVAVPPALSKAASLSDEDRQMLRQELNVKKIDFTDDPGTLGETIVQVNARKVGPRLGGRVQEIIAAGKRGAFEQRKDGAILILDEVLAPDEAEVVYRGREGEAVAAAKGIVASIDTRVTQDLEQEGRMRDLVRAIQKLRKDAGLSITDPITLSVEGMDDVLAVHREQIEQETHATMGENAGQVQQVDLEGTMVAIHFVKT